ncbi:hypothetical protein BC834DRAFT_872572 [Gloeopeniophorella convolvens]|nr:hypothetical protein BC834DRAFT_872572 [Gloeopeniophorella convolvens]
MLGNSEAELRLRGRHNAHGHVRQGSRLGLNDVRPSVTYYYAGVCRVSYRSLKAIGNASERTLGRVGGGAMHRGMSRCPRGSVRERLPITLYTICMTDHRTCAATTSSHPRQLLHGKHKPPCRCSGHDRRREPHERGALSCKCPPPKTPDSSRGQKI